MTDKESYESCFKSLEKGAEFGRRLQNLSCIEIHFGVCCFACLFFLGLHTVDNRYAWHGLTFNLYPYAAHGTPAPARICNSLVLMHVRGGVLCKSLL